MSQNANWDYYIKFKDGKKMTKFNNIYKSIIDNSNYKIFNEFNINIKCKMVSDMIDENDNSIVILLLKYYILFFYLN